MKNHTITLENCENALMRLNVNNNFNPRPNLNALNRASFTGYWMKQSSKRGECRYSLVKYLSGDCETIHSYQSKHCFYHAVRTVNELAYNARAK